MNNHKFIILIALLLGGCNTLPRAPTTIIKQLDPIRVEIPIVQPCVTDDVPLPELFMGKLTDEDIKDPGKVVQYYTVDVTQLKGVILRQKVLLDACRDGKLPPPATPVPTITVPPFKPATPVSPVIAKPEPAPTPPVINKPETPKVKPRVSPLTPSGRTFAPPPPPQ